MDFTCFLAEKALTLHRQNLSGQQSVVRVTAFVLYMLHIICKYRPHRVGTRTTTPRHPTKSLTARSAVFLMSNA